MLAGSSRKIAIGVLLGLFTAAVGALLAFLPSAERGLLSALSPTVVRLLIGGVGVVGLLGSLGLIRPAVRVWRGEPLIWIDQGFLHMATFWRELQVPVAEILEVSSSGGALAFVRVVTQDGTYGALPVFPQNVAQVASDLESLIASSQADDH